LLDQGEAGSFGQLGEIFGAPATYMMGGPVRGIMVKQPKHSALVGNRDDYITARAHKPGGVCNEINRGGYMLHDLKESEEFAAPFKLFGRDLFHPLIKHSMTLVRRRFGSVAVEFNTRSRHAGLPSEVEEMSFASSDIEHPC